MQTNFGTQQGRLEYWDASEAQAEIFWMAFQALSAPAQQAVRRRLISSQEMPQDLAIELESWQAAAAEALLNFETQLYETQ